MGYRQGPRPNGPKWRERQQQEYINAGGMAADRYGHQYTISDANNLKARGAKMKDERNKK
jgi:hypothetical protein